MRKTFILLLFAICTISCDDIISQMKRHGLYGTVVYRVVDEDGAAVSNAAVKACFTMADGGKKRVYAETDAEGIAVVRAKTNFDVHTQVTKAGYYKSDHEHMFFTLDENKMHDGEWIVVPTNTVELRRIGMQKRVSAPNVAVIDNMEREKVYCFDFLSGRVIDSGSSDTNVCLKLSFTAESLEGNEPASRVVLTVWDDSGGGLQMHNYAGASRFVFPHNAPTNGYSRSLVFSNWPKSGEFPIGHHERGEYAIFKIYERCNGCVINDAVHYGIIRAMNIYRRFGEKTANADFFYYFNDCDDDVNTEYVHQ